MCQILTYPDACLCVCVCVHVRPCASVRVCVCVCVLPVDEQMSVRRIKI